MGDAATEIANLLYTYGSLVDAGDFAGIGRLFAHCAVSDASGRLDVRGADAVTRLYERTTRRYDDGTPRTKHVITNPIIEVDAGAGVATCRAHYLVLQQTDALPLQPIITGHYEDEFERVDGRWRFRGHRFFVDQVGDLAQHLLVDLEGAAGGG
jgi:3-phenylpropionate/cinnamic acid dioxygenase small subunit